MRLFKRYDVGYVYEVHNDNWAYDSHLGDFRSAKKAREYAAQYATKDPMVSGMFPDTSIRFVAFINLPFGINIILRKPVKK